MAGAVYLGPAETFEYSGHVYVQGDSIPMSDKLLRHHAAMGHRFDGIEPAGAIEPTPRAPMVFDDRGQGHPVPGKAGGTGPGVAASKKD
jgi:hypothetical protein